MEKIKIYLIARISKDAHEWNNWVSSFLYTDKIQVFKPHEHNPWNSSHEGFSYQVFEVDLNAIKSSDIGLCLPGFGNDCAWECGWYSNSSKPLVAFVHHQTNWLRDWMIKGGINYVITDNRNTYQKLINDHILHYKKIIFLNDMNELPLAIEKIYFDNYVIKAANKTS
ncbi:MAG: hypothetical protein WC675_04965 [Patescibacteria group bacterium]|jgi:nucleoside 2-deoxyribosyltransferase